MVMNEDDLEFDPDSWGDPEEDAGYCQEKYGPYTLSEEEMTLSSEDPA